MYALLAFTLLTAPFEAEQRRFERVRGAFERTEEAVRARFREAGAAYPPKAIFLRVLKHERELELWALGKKDRYALVRRYAICAASGALGPKRRRGDLQVPEGFYRIDRFNPWSNFHLSLGVDYPNASDRALGDKRDLGGDIFIHGDCASIGCVAITDPMIEEVYVAAVKARSGGQRSIPVHIFPRRLDEAGLAALEGDDALLAFWKSLAPGYAYFEAHRALPKVSVGPDGLYRLRGRLTPPPK